MYISLLSRSASSWQNVLATYEISGVTNYGLRGMTCPTRVAKKNKHYANTLRLHPRLVLRLHPTLPRLCRLIILLSPPLQTSLLALYTSLLYNPRRYSSYHHRLGLRYLATITINMDIMLTRLSHTIFHHDQLYLKGPIMMYTQ